MGDLDNKVDNVAQCPLREYGLGGDYDNEYWCLETGRPDADMRGGGYDKCTYVGDFTKCPIHLSSSLRNKGNGRENI
jgi:hypothetical protein